MGKDRAEAGELGGGRCNLAPGISYLNDRFPPTFYQFPHEVTLQFADQLRGKLLLVHGTGDDNVHFQNSVAFVDAMVKADKDFQTLYYPNRNHGIYGGNTRLHLYRQMTNFVLQNL